MRRAVRTPRLRITRPVALALATVAGLACSSSSPQLDTIQGQVTDVQHQILEVRKDGATKDEIADLLAALEQQERAIDDAKASLRDEIRVLAALIEELDARLDDSNYRFSELTQQIAATNQELKALRSAPELARGGSALGQTSGGGDPQAIYQTAYNDYLRGSYDLAILGFRQYLDAFPEMDLADNARYWIGESFYRQSRFHDAIREFDLVLDRYPGSDKTASAVLRKGYALLELGEQAKGVVQLQRVIREFPTTDEANLARQQLTSLGLDPASSSP